MQYHILSNKWGAVYLRGKARFLFCVAAQVGLADGLVSQQFLAGAFQGDAAGLHHVAHVGNLQGHVGVLLDEQDGDALAVDLLDDLKDALDHDGGQAPERARPS